MSEPISIAENNILFVDDENFIIDLLTRIFTGKVKDIFSANCGDDALKIFEKNKIDLAIIDIKMPGMSGVELLEKIKTISPETVCIMLTGHGDKEHVQQAIRLGAFDFLDKPSSREVILNRTVKGLCQLNYQRSVKSIIIELLKLHPNEIPYDEFDQKTLYEQEQILKALLSIVRMKVINLSNYREDLKKKAV